MFSGTPGTSMTFLSMSDSLVKIKMDVHGIHRNSYELHGFYSMNFLGIPRYQPWKSVEKHVGIGPGIVKRGGLV